MCGYVSSRDSDGWSEGTVVENESRVCLEGRRDSARLINTYTCKWRATATMTSEVTC